MSKLFNAKFMNLDIKTETKEETIKYLANLMSENIADVNGYIGDVMAREEISTTGIGDGVAIPHAKSEFVNIPTVAFGRSTKGIDWESLDDEPAHLVFQIAVPSGAGDEHLMILRTLAVSLMDDDFKEQLLKANTPEEAEALLLENIDN